MTFTVYKIINSINGKIYIGATTKHISVRFMQHCKNPASPLYNDISDYGQESFSIEIVEECLDKGHMFAMESYWIKRYRECQPDSLYNIKKASKPFVVTPEHIAICNAIKAHFTRNQGWLAREIGMSESFLSKKINDLVDWTQPELDKVNKALGTDFKL